MEPNRPFQRKGAKSNSHVGREFEAEAQAFFLNQKLSLRPKVCIPIGINGSKEHEFDLGDEAQRILVECKAHKWTEGNNVPSAKMIAWNEAMFLFHAAPGDYRKILFVLYHFSPKRSETLAEYYIRTYLHLIPKGVEIWEFDDSQKTGKRLH